MSCPAPWVHMTMYIPNSLDQVTEIRAVTAFNNLEQCCTCEQLENETRTTFQYGGIIYIETDTKKTI